MPEGAPTRALDLDRFELPILNEEVLALGHLVTAALCWGRPAAKPMNGINALQRPDCVAG
jgi:hypothetical protein